MTFYFKLEHLQRSFVKVQPEHPEIDGKILQEGYEILSNYSAAFYNRTKTRPPRSIEFKPHVIAFTLDFSLGSISVLTLSIPLLILTLILVLAIRIFRLRF